MGELRELKPAEPEEFTGNGVKVERLGNRVVLTHPDEATAIEAFGVMKRMFVAMEEL